jgi:anaerobic magnesium-protoporphyrin IX monomethyl ester cyclase
MNVTNRRCAEKSEFVSEFHRQKYGSEHYKADEWAAIEESEAILQRCRERAADRKYNRVALIQPRKGGRPALGLLYIGAYLEDCGYQVRIFEFMDELYPPNIRFNEKLFQQLIDYNPEIIGFGVISSTMKITRRLFPQMKAAFPSAPIICGGKHGTSNPEDFLSQGADVCVLGEGEITVPELFDALNFDEPLEKVRGIAYLENGQLRCNDERPFLPLDHIKRPAFHLVDYDKFVDCRLQSIPGHYLRTGFIFGSRGCPYQCTFCMTNIRIKYRERSIDDLLDEMEWQIKTYNIEAFVILDDLFYLKEKRVIEFCEKIKQRGIKTKFMCHGRVDKAKVEIVHLMKEAGLLLLAVGVESGSQKILDAMQKGTTVEQNLKAFEVYNQVGINTFAFIIVGHPEETEEDRELTRQMLKTIKATNVAVNYYMPMPGTDSYQFELENAKYLVDGDDFEDFTYTTDYPEFSTSVPLDQLKQIGDEFQAMSLVNRNKNLFSYPDFIRDMSLLCLTRPWVILEAFYHRYISHKTKQMSVLGLFKDAITFDKQRFFNP